MLTLNWFIFKAIEGCKKPVPLNVKANDATSLAKVDNREFDAVEEAKKWGTRFLIGAGVIVGLALVSGITALLVFFGLLKSASKSSNKGTTIVLPPLPAALKLDTDISRSLCPNGDVTKCPDHLQDIILAIKVCSLVDEDDLTHKIMRKNVDLGILREIVLSKHVRNDSSMNSHVTIPDM